MNYKYIIFDLDGTVTDSAEGIINSVKYSLKKMGIEETDSSKPESFIGPPLTDSYRKYYGLNADESEKAVKFYREYYAEKGIEENRLYSGIKELLKKNISNGLNNFIATTKPLYFAEKVLKQFSIESLFTDITGSNMDGSMTDKGELINSLIERNKLNKSQTLMIGDRDYDIIGAKKNSIASCAVLYGYGSEEELMTTSPDHICRSVDELSELLCS